MIASGSILQVVRAIVNRKIYNCINCVQNVSHDKLCIGIVCGKACVRCMQNAVNCSK